MALRHAFPEVELGDLRLEKEPAVAPARLKKAHKIRVRPGNDVDKIMSEVLTYDHCLIEATVGCGKSTVMPAAMAKLSKHAVYHALPSIYVAAATYDYMLTQDVGVEYALALKPEDLVAKKGVVVTTYACLVAAWLSKRDAKEPIGRVHLYADEVHESDAYTGLIRAHGPNVPGVVSYVEATATSDPERMPMRETKGEITSEMFDPCSPRDWDIYQDGKPWSISSFSDNVAVYVDDDVAADKLVSGYNSAGFTAFRITARMDLKLFRHAMKMAWTHKGIVVLVMTYPFRNALTIPGDRCIDSGVVQYTEIDGSAAVKKYRTMYSLEKYQTQGRMARCAGTKATYYYPKHQYSNAICDLEGTEIEANALMHRLLGFSPPSEVRPLARFSAGFKFPKDLRLAFNSAMPLVLLSEDEMTDLFVPATDGKQVEQVADVLDSYGDSPVTPAHDYFTDLVKEHDALGLRDLSTESILAHLDSYSSAPSTLQWPNYYVLRGKLASVGVHVTDWESLVRDVLRDEFTVLGMDPGRRTDVMGELLLHYNACVAQVAAVAMVTASGDSLLNISSHYPEMVKKWARYVQSKAVEKEARGKSILQAVDKLRLPESEFANIEPDKELERGLARNMADALRGMVQQARELVPSEDVFQAVKQAIGRVELPALEAADFSSGIDVASGRDNFRVHQSPIRVGKRRAYAISIAAERSLQWGVKDYVDAIGIMLDKTGLSLSAIHTLELRNSKIDPGRVIQIVRDKGKGRHRKRVTFDVAR